MRLIELALIVGAIAVFVVVNAKEAPPRDEWQLRRSDQAGQVQLTLDRRKGFDHRTISGHDVPWERISGVTPEMLERGGAVRFEYKTDAGRLEGKGEARLGRASGEFRFHPNAEFATELAKLGYSATPSEGELFSALMHGITLELARSMAQTGVTTNYRDLEKMAIHGVDPAYVRDVRALGYGDLRAEDFVKARIHGVDTAYLTAIKKTGYQLSMDRMVELRIHGVDPDYIEELGRAGLRPEARELMEMRNHGVTPAFLKTLAESGYKEMPAREVIELANHGVSPEFIRDVRAAGYAFTARELTELRIHGVDGEYLEKLKAAGFERLPAREIVKLKTHGID